MKNLHFVVIVVATLSAIVGCAYAPKAAPRQENGIVGFRNVMSTAFLDECKKVAVGDGYVSDNRWEYNGKFDIIYINEAYLSFREDTWIDSGEFAAHGGTSYTIGTINRKTGEVLKATDLIPACRRVEALKVLREGVLKEIGEGNLLNDPMLTDNCYVGADGIHFVYNEYQIAPFCLGPIEVIIELPSDAKRPIIVKKVITRSIYE